MVVADNNNYYQDDNRYSYDNNHQKKSSHVDIQKIQCVNSNINVNGIDITQIPEDGTATVAANEAAGPEAANTQNGNGLADRINFDKNLLNICVNLNENEQGLPEEEEPIILRPDGLLTAEWWQWITDIPREINPLLDETGEDCAVDQQGQVWFLAGTPGDTEADGIIIGDAERQCTIPEGKKILFPIITAACLELTDAATIRDLLGLDPNEPIPEAQLEEGLRLCAESIIDTVDLLEASIDGKEIPQSKLKDFFRVQSPLFTMTLRADNPFDIPPESSFPGIPQRSISEGYWVLVKGLEPGEHTIEFTGGITGVFETHVLYHITIE